MIKYIALLRGINVSGAKLIKMDQLKIYFESMKLDSVLTYIQSGNVLFKSGEKNKEKLNNKIEQGLEEKLGYKVDNFLRTITEIETVVEQNPFKDIVLDKNTVLYVAFLNKELDSEYCDVLDKNKDEIDIMIPMGAHIYWLAYKNKGKSKITSNFFEKKLQVNATVRNWNTVNKIIELGLKI